MNKAQLIEAVALHANLSKVDARKAVDALLSVTEQTLREGEKLTLSGFGTFHVHHSAPRTGRNPRTGAAVPVPARKTVKFRAVFDVE